MIWRVLPLETVPNFSEGRDAALLDAIGAALEHAGARVLDVHVDADHNRSVYTACGSADALEAGLRRALDVAIARIDLRRHAGGHPRMGAADVIPFVPLRSISMDEVVEFARGFGAELAETLHIPVYLYDRAATSPERANLADVRRGEFEGLREAVARGERLPDFGPHQLGRAGATAVGARKPLVAFNLYLTGSEDAAKDIARAVRESSGGLPAVRAIGFAVAERGAVTVSMNLVDVDVTSPRVAFDAVSALAAQRGMQVLSSEIVGFAPAAALAEGDPEHMRLEGFDADGQILERLVSAGGDRR
jgi:glutamate formiminotransferase